jgi:phosphomannomutase
VPVGIKYIVEVPRMTTSYKLEPDDVLPSNWMDRLLIGGEESSGLTTRGHVADKDGIWANLLIMDMVAYYQKPLSEIWKMVCNAQDGWTSYGGRVDVDASDRAKEKLISYYLDAFKGKKPGEVMIEGYPVLYAGGIRYDMVEIFLGDKEGRKRNFLRIRASGTEPINRIYTETSDPELWRKLLNFVMAKLDEFSIEEIQGAYRIERLADLLANTSPGDWEKMARAVKDKLAKAGWKRDDLITTLHIKQQTIARHNQHIVHQWLEIL